jgi:penicillin-binding protein 1B
VGYDNVVAMANRAGMNYKIQPTPAVALGAYEITPLEAAGAYTMFANSGTYVKPSFISLIRSQDGASIYKDKPETHQALDPRVAYLMTSMMEEVLRTGTAAGVRARYAFNVPAAGKTGTSHDGWFAGYTSELLCVVWVGFDDNRELNLEGAHSAAPIWAEFMKHALAFREYHDAKPFQAPDGIVTVDICPLSGMPAAPACPKVRSEVYIAGTQPVGICPLHGGRQGITNIAGWDTEEAAPVRAVSQTEPPPRSNVAQTDSNAVARRAARQIQPAAALPPAASKKTAKDAGKNSGQTEKKGLLHRILGVFK